MKLYKIHKVIFTSHLNYDLTGRTTLYCIAIYIYILDLCRLPAVREVATYN